MNASRLEHLATEQIDPRFASLDTMSVMNILERMNEADHEVPSAVRRCLKPISDAVECISERLSRGGRLLYVGAGTSGRLAALDAYECPPTFGTEPDVVQALLAGGKAAKASASEEAEDEPEQGAFDLQHRRLTETDVVVGIAASGRTPYVMGALHYARNIKAATIALSCNPDSEISSIADIAIEVIVGAEVLAGSTRLKAGTAQKMVLNMLSTASMIRQGRVYRNYMVDMQASNDKLRTRSRRLVQQATGADEVEALQVLEQTSYHVKTSIVMILSGVDREKAANLLTSTNGWIREALRLASIN